MSKSKTDKALEEVSEVRSSEINPTDEKDYRCAPSKQFKDGSCIPLSKLVEMAEAYNEVDTKNKIRVSTTLETLNPRKYKRYLVREFNKRLEGTNRKVDEEVS